MGALVDHASLASGYTWTASDGASAAANAAVAAALRVRHAELYRLPKLRRTREVQPSICLGRWATLAEGRSKADCRGCSTPCERRVSTLMGAIRAVCAITRRAASSVFAALQNVSILLLSFAFSPSVAARPTPPPAAS